MKAFKRFSLALIALMITAALLVACGDSPTPVPAATTAAATATTAPKPTTAAPTTAPVTTAAPTTAVATTAAPTTAAPTVAAGSLPVPTGTKALNLTPTLTTSLIGQFSKGSNTSEVKFEAYVTGQAPTDLATYYDQKLVELGYTSYPQTHLSRQQGNALFLSASFTKDNHILSLALIGPVDQAIMTELAGYETAKSVSPDQDFSKQVKLGDNLILSFTQPGTLQPVTATLGAPTTAAAGTLPVPTGVKILTIAPAFSKALVTQFTSTFTVDPGKVEVVGYSTTQALSDISTFYEENLDKLGFTIQRDTQKSQTVGTVNIASASFTRTAKSGDIEVATIVLYGPLDANSISQLATPAGSTGTTDPNFAKQLNPGDTLVLSFDFRVPSGTNTGSTTPSPATSPFFPAPPNGRPLTLSAVGDKAAFGDSASTGLSGLTINNYLVHNRPETLSVLYGQVLTGNLGYSAHKDTDTYNVKGTVSYVGQNFTRGTADIYLYYVGPLDQATIDYIQTQLKNSGATDDVTSQLQVGDTIVRAYQGTISATGTATATTAAATTASSSGDVQAIATELKLSTTMQQALISQLGTDAKNATIKAYVSKDDFATVASYLDQNLTAGGYTSVPNSQHKDSQNGVNVLVNGYTNGQNNTVFALFGPIDDATLTELAKLDTAPIVPATDLKAQVKAGDTVFFIISGTK